MRAMIVGGEPRYAFGKVKENLARMGIDVVEHIGSDGKYERINGPRGCDCLILMKDVCSHRLFDEARKVASIANIPCVTTSKRWAVMKNDVGEMLQHRGIEAVKQTAVNLAFEKAARKARETEEAERRALEMATKGAAIASDASIRRLREATVLVLEDRPDLVLTPDRLTEKVTGLLHDTELRGVDAPKTIRDEARTTHQHWMIMGKRMSPSDARFAEKRRIIKIRNAWLSRTAKDHFAKTGHVLGCREIQEVASLVFGGKLSEETFQQIRTSHLGTEKTPVRAETPEVPKDTNMEQRRPGVRTKSTVEQTHRLLRDFFEVARAAGLVTFADVDRAAGLASGKAAKWGNHPPSNLHRGTKTLILNAMQRWRKEQATRPIQETLPLTQTAEVHQPGRPHNPEGAYTPPAGAKPIADRSTEGLLRELIRRLDAATFEEAVERIIRLNSATVTLTFTKGRTETEQKMITVANALRDLGMAIPDEIVRHFAGEIPDVFDDPQRVGMVTSKVGASVLIPDGATCVWIGKEG